MKSSTDIPPRLGSKSGDSTSQSSPGSGPTTTGKDARSAIGLTPLPLGQSPTPSPNPLSPFPNEDEPPFTSIIRSETTEESSDANPEQEPMGLDVREQAGDGAPLGARDEDAVQQAPPEYLAKDFRAGEIEVVPATELEIAAAIVVLRARSVHFGVPKEVLAYPFAPEYGWHQAALNFIRQNQSEASKGHGTFI